MCIPLYPVQSWASWSENWELGLGLDNWGEEANYKLVKCHPMQQEQIKQL